MSTQHQLRVSHNKSKKYCNSSVLDDSSSLSTTSEMNTSSIIYIITFSQTFSLFSFKSASVLSTFKKIKNSILIIIMLYILILTLSAVKALFFNEINVEDF